MVVEAPTGAGKSAIAVALTREAQSAYIVTAQKILQEQYLRDFPELALMKGRANYPCLVAPTHAAAAPCIAGRRFPECDDCPYFTAKDVAINASGAIMNYAYYLAELNYSAGFSTREVLVLDEAHNTEAALMTFIEVSLSDASLARVGIGERVPHVIDEEEYFEFATDVLPALKSRSEEFERQLKHEDLPGEVMLTVMQGKQWLDNQVRRIQLLESSRDEDGVEWVVQRLAAGDGQSVTYKPVTVSAFAEPLLFSFGERVVMLSATILDPPTYLAGLGIDADEAEVIRVASSFPPENRPIVVRPAAKLTRHHLDRQLPRLALAVAEIMELHAAEKGVIHAHSYRIAGYLEKNLPRDLAARLVTHRTSFERDGALARHVESGEPTVLLTPSMTEGIDLAHELSRWQVICKIPYPYLGDPQVARRRERDAAWYDWRTCLKIVQAYGRSVRSEDDYAVTYLLDADFPGFLRRQRGRFPEWFLEAIEA